jgi:hypothetical protein
MSACANCARELRPDWKFCIYCGTPTGVVPRRPDAVAEPVAESAESADSALEPAAENASASAAHSAPSTLDITPPPAPPAGPPISVRTRSRERVRRRRVNPLALVALVLGCLVSPVAALFGHIALAQIAASGERGRLPAIIAIVLGYASLAFIVGLAVVYLANNP